MTPPAPTPAIDRRRPLKLLGAVAIFVAMVGGYAILAARHAADAPLPGSETPAGPCTIWFVGSSTIARWSTLGGDMAGWDARRRGVDGALIPTLTHRLQHEPQGPAPLAIVFYGGENDIAAGASAADTASAFRAFLAAKVAQVGATPMIALTLKPSPARSVNQPQHVLFDDWLTRFAARRPDLAVVDIRSAMLAGEAPGAFFVEDGIHMNPAGYALWTARIRQALAAIVPPGRRAACRAG
ncbi:GDSL-type esterase/lipase family protein [Sphingomonas sp. KR1UV-12]|uniref:GDSL-type esterase/lipase family protein n=1 Tax=Sphingomonas aurea TaxID=3063994 RepID=A0ABT9EM28_9SPHN|nr:GDSL-type esterase/lipase family protein [Sphingomonas sp. KR1UV-12]MDP1027877.1 GDSL-type esterase/lipase family protein [Sphingomonas sp. KR1UV-12]